MGLMRELGLLVHQIVKPLPTTEQQGPVSQSTRVREDVTEAHPQEGVTVRRTVIEEVIVTPGAEVDPSAFQRSSE